MGLRVFLHHSPHQYCTCPLPIILWGGGVQWVSRLESMAEAHLSFLRAGKSLAALRELVRPTEWETVRGEIEHYLLGHEEVAWDGEEVREVNGGKGPLAKGTGIRRDCLERPEGSVIHLSHLRIRSRKHTEQSITFPLVCLPLQAKEPLHLRPLRFRMSEGSKAGAGAGAALGASTSMCPAQRSGFHSEVHERVSQMGRGINTVGRPLEEPLVSLRAWAAVHFHVTLDARASQVGEKPGMKNIEKHR